VSKSRSVVLALLALVVAGLTVVGAASAALPELLTRNRELANGTVFEGTSKSTEFSMLNGIAGILCATSRTEAQIEGRGVLGPFHIVFSTCKTTLGGTCTGLGDPNAGEILVLGSFHIVYDKLTGLLGAAILFLLGHVHFECTNVPVVGRVLILVLGQVLCLIEPIRTLQTRSKVKCEAAGSGDPSEVVYWNDNSEEVNIREGLKGSENEGAERMAAELTVGAAEVTTREELEIMA
jgi:hypothetical protein